MSARTDWGLFAKDGTPVAVGDAWHRWCCPSQRYEPAGYEHPYTGEWIDEGYTPVKCPFRYVGPKLERCETCGMEFRYP